MTVESNALEAAFDASRKHTFELTHGAVEEIISAYLAALPNRTDLIERLEAAIALGERTGSRGKHPTNIYNVAFEALTALREAAKALEGSAGTATPAPVDRSAIIEELARAAEIQFGGTRGLNLTPAEIIRNVAKNLSIAAASPSDAEGSIDRKLAAELENLNVSDQELLRIRNSCEGNDGDLRIWAKMVQKLADHIRTLRAIATASPSKER